MFVKAVQGGSLDLLSLRRPRLASAFCRFSRRQIELVFLFLDRENDGPVWYAKALQRVEMSFSDRSPCSARQLISTRMACSRRTWATFRRASASRTRSVLIFLGPVPHLSREASGRLILRLSPADE